MSENKQPQLEKLGENQYQFENMYGDKSEVFFYAGPYRYGFAPVKRTENDKEMLYRDMVGNISTSCHTNIGKMFYRFAHGNIKFESLPAICFINDKFCEGVRLLMLDKIARQIALKSQKGQHINIKQVKLQKDKVIDMCEEKRKLGFQIMTAKMKARKNSRKQMGLEDLDNPIK